MVTSFLRSLQHLLCNAFQNGHYNDVVAHPHSIASYAVPVRQYRILQSRCLQCLSHDKPPCDLLTVAGHDSLRKGLTPSGKTHTNCFAIEKKICKFDFFKQLTTSVRCMTHAGHTQSVAAIRGLVVIQTFCSAQTSVLADSFVASNPLLLLHSTVELNRRWR